MNDKVATQLEWRDGVRFEAVTGSHSFVVDGDQGAGASPMQHLLVALGGCMGIDIADILEKMRTPPTRLAVSLEGERPAEPPRRFERIVMTVQIQGDVPLRNVERAISLSRDRYCSVWRTLDQDTVLEVDVEVIPTPPPA
jgi:putative redox protein